MNWKELIFREMTAAYGGAEHLLDLVGDGDLQWKPSTGSNWMSTGQLLKHMAGACGESGRGFITGDWSQPDGTDAFELSREEMLPPAEKFPSVTSVGEARRHLEKDKKLAFELLAACSEKDLAEKVTFAPWDPEGLLLGHRLLQMVDHLKSHKAQLFYYLKLQGKPVDTCHLWGM